MIVAYPFPMQLLNIFEEVAPVYPLSGMPAPGAAIMVWLNGLLMRQGLDYVLEGNSVRLTGTVVAGKPIIQVLFWVTVASAPPAVAVT